MTAEALSAHPNLFIVGAAKSGSSSLSHWLSSHPEVVGSNDQELRFLMDKDDPLARTDGYWGIGLEGYGTHYPQDAFSGAYKRALDTTPLYYYQDTAQKVIPTLGQSDIVFVLRDPTQRILSLFRYAKNNISVLPKTMTFEEFVAEVRKEHSNEFVEPRPMLKNAIQHGLYHEYVEKWVELVGAERVHVLIFEDLVDDTLAMVKSLAARLDIDPGFYDSFDFKVYNESFSTRSKRVHKLSRHVKEFLPDPILQMAKPHYMRLNSTKFKTELTEGEISVLSELKDEFGPWQQKLPQDVIVRKHAEAS